MVCIIHQHESAIGIHEFPPKYVEIKQHNSEQPVDQRRNQKGNSDNTEKEMKMDTPHTKT